MTREELKAEGFRFVGYEICRGADCKVKIEKWRSVETINGQHVVRFMDAVGTFQSHFITCPNADNFRKKKAEKTAAPKSGNLFD